MQRDIVSNNVQIEYIQKYTAQTMAKNHELAYENLLKR